MTGDRTDGPHTHQVLVVGGGLSGLCTAERLQAAGIRDVVVLERGDAVGASRPGLPGTPSELPALLYPYVLSETRGRPGWPGRRPTAEEVGGYVRGLAAAHALTPIIRTGQEVTRLEYDEAGRRWLARTAAGDRFAGRSVVLALGPVAVGRTPDIPGLDRYAGTVIHAAEWDGGYDVTGERVAVIGTGAAATQLVPELARRARRLKVFQRSPRWILPWPGHTEAAWDRALLRALPGGRAAARQAVMCAHEPWALNPLLRPAVRTVVQRFAASHLRYRVADSWLRRLLTPTYTFGRRPALVSSEYYPALCRPNTTLLHWPIATVSAAGIRTSDALEHQVDTLVLATGSEMLGVGARFPVVGRGGRTLARERTDRGGAYKGVNVAGFPNLFLVPGPGPGPGGHAALLYLDARIDYTVRALDRLADGDIRSLDIRADVQRTHERVLRGRLSRDLWATGDIRGGGHVTEFRFDPEIYPGPAIGYARTLADLRLADYTVEPGGRGPLQPVFTSNGGRA